MPRGSDALAFHRRVAILSILVALLAGSLDAMMWREAQRRAARARVEADIAAQRAAMAAQRRAVDPHAATDAPAYASWRATCPHR